jgi:hypothetical protein
VAVAGVLAEADVGDEDEILGGWRGLEGAQPLLDDAVFVPGSGALLVLGLGQAKEQKPAQAEAGGLFGLADRLAWIRWGGGLRGRGRGRGGR